MQSRVSHIASILSRQRSGKNVYFNFKKKIYAGVAAVSAVVLVSLTFASGASALEAPVGLGTSSAYAVLSGEALSNTWPTNVSGTAGGDLGSYPNGAFTGSGSVTTNGTIFTAAVAQTGLAQDALVTAIGDAAGRTPSTPIAADLAGLALKQGVYNSASSIGLNGTLTLDAEDNPDAVFIFQAGSALTTGTGSTIELINGAQACNVFWQVGSSATLGVGSTFVGHVLAETSITANTAALIHGSLLAHTGAVSLDTNTIVNDLCTEVTPTGSASPSAAASPTTTNGGGLPNTDSSDFSTPLFVGLGLAVLGSVVLVARRKRS